ncbi:MAG: molecular chaperone DnaJ [Chloroflexi bacterium]|nr:molecular chaperone DnaJ [Chloroflexota bacterium]
MTTKRDYYEVLGLPKDATAEDIKKAYRRLALEFHPDRNKTPGASEKFKEITEAYQVLNDTEKRATYDRFGHVGTHAQAGAGFSGFENFGGFGDIFDAFFGGEAATRRGPRPGRDLEMHITLEFEEAVFGAEKKIEVEREEACERCTGTRSEPDHPPVRCSTCGGSGQVRRVQRNIFGQFAQISTCSTCNGLGRIVQVACKDCGGRGRKRERRSLFVNVPAGIEEGTRIRLSGEGEPGDPGSPQGDLYLYVTVKPHELFEREENDLLIEMGINLAQAALGATVEVPTLKASKAVKIPPGTQSGAVFRIRGEGVPDINSGRRGDLLVRVEVAVPEKLSARQRQLLEQLSETLEPSAAARSNGRGGKGGLFGKIRDAIYGEASDG